MQAAHPCQRPLYKLSVDLLRTYKKVNSVYYARKKRNGDDDENYDLIVHAGDIFDNRYRVTGFIGKGSFGLVVKCFDMVAEEHVAVKVIKNRRPFRHQGSIEIKLLSFLNKRDPDDQFCILRLKRSFEWKNHICIVQELLSYNLYDLLRHTQFRGVSLNLVKKFGHQILCSLLFLAMPEIDIVHCDLKPENILLRNHRRSTVKLIDFGSSCRRTERVFSYIQSRFYRSPEVLVNHSNITQAVDMWSLACILVELHTGKPLFPGKNEFDQVRKIVEVLGLPPASMLQAAPQAKVSKFFNALPDGTFQLKGSQAQKFPLPAKTVRVLLESHEPNSAFMSPNHKEECAMLVDLVGRMLEYDPKYRITPSEALDHDFFKSLAKEKE
ncbi:Protein kinase domain [Carpediemonas membranifera]|uniref:Protein kinase domain n=1 Tax=Carpediemonas membranifera TaxID=201153 RepID=A0A8J6ATS9_9EUKA|nr:Protein kinase domain [Carpediemonas membranifera]|eukprot:KAG9394396.1 Protein kinase domain [Carpediemonas membranifera]